MERAIALARQCESELGKVSPEVGAVVAGDGVVLGEAFRGELAPGDHASGRQSRREGGLRLASRLPTLPQVAEIVDVEYGTLHSWLKRGLLRPSCRQSSGIGVPNLSARKTSSRPKSSLISGTMGFRSSGLAKVLPSSTLIRVP